MSDKRTRLTMDQRMRAITYIARGDTMSQVAAHMLKDYDITITESALYKIKKDNIDTIHDIQERLADSIAADAEAILKKSRTAIAKRLDKSETDARKIEELDEQYRNGEIDYDTYKREKSGLIKLNISELLRISSTMHTQTLKLAAPPDQLTPGAMTVGPGSSPAQLEALLQSIKEGNTVEMQRLVFNPKDSHDKFVEV